MYCCTACTTIAPHSFCAILFVSHQVDNNSTLVYDPETNSYQWTNDKTGDASCSICIESYGTCVCYNVHMFLVEEIKRSCKSDSGKHTDDSILTQTHNSFNHDRTGGCDYIKSMWPCISSRMHHGLVIAP